MKRIIILALIVTSGLNASQESKGIESAGINQNPEVKKLMGELNGLGSDCNWPKRKGIIARLIQVHDTNPGDILYGYSKKPLSEAVLRNDLLFASFLLNHKANQNTTKGYYSSSNVLFDADTKAMAQLLFGHGAHLIEDQGKKILRTIILQNYEPSLIPLYVQHGADVNALDAQGVTPLIRVVLSIDTTRERRKQYVSELLQADALISPGMSPVSDKPPWTAPALLKKQLDEADRADDRAALQEIRAMIKNAYEGGEYAQQKKAIEVHLIPDLANLCVNTYEELEKYPPRPI